MGGTAASSSSTTSTSTTPATGAPAAPYGRLREIYARQNDVLQVGLDGVGFLFLGFPDSMGQADGMAFKSKENRNNKTWFTFQALKIGTYDLDFLQQDNTAGRTAKETVRVHVVSDQDFNAAVAQQPGPDPDVPGTEETGDPVFARKLSTLGSYQAAVVELLKGYKDGNPPLNDQIAGLYMRMGSYEAAGKYYGKNLSPQNAFTSSAVTGLVRIAVFQNDQQGLLFYLKQFLALKDPSMEEPLIQCVRMEKARSEIGMALDLAGEYLKRFPDGAWRDEADYLTAQLLEADSQFRDLARARDLYSGILTSHPESAFADTARQRLQYIDRHFIQVR
jgi:tetratricopeptide (TPR) repeat protein